MKKTFAALTAAAAVAVLSACSTTPPAQAPAGSRPSSAAAEPTTTAAAPETSENSTAITITAGGESFDATINNSQVSQDFLATLPTTLPWNRNAGIEYITELPAPLTETGPFYTSVEAADMPAFELMASG